MSVPPHVPSCVCLGCGCACDDLVVTVTADSIAAIAPPCARGARWFGNGRSPARARVDGGDATLGEAIAAAAARLSRAAAPAVRLAGGLTCEAQGACVALADLLRARLDGPTSPAARAAILAAQERGRAGATLGEIRNRADLVVYWGVDPDVDWPRFRARYTPRDGAWLTGPHAPRTVVAVDVGARTGPADADHRVVVPEAAEASHLTLLAAGQGPFPVVVSEYRYVALVADAERAAPGAAARAGGLIDLARAWNADTRCALVALRAGGNVNGAEACVTWQTGYPGNVDFSRGYPRYLPPVVDGTDGDDDLGVSGRPDATLVAGDVAHPPPGGRVMADAARTIVVGPGASTVAGAAVAIDTATAGIHEAGTVLRMDDVPLPVRVLIPGPPAARDVLSAILAAVREARR